MINIEALCNDNPAIAGEALIYLKWAHSKTRRANTARLNEGITTRQSIAEYAINGHLYVMVWGRDCDFMESTHVSKIKASQRAIDELEEDIAANAEGPYSLTVITPEDAQEFKPSWFDRAADQEGY